MPSRREGWGGAEREPDRAKHKHLFKDEQYRLIGARRGDLQGAASRDFEQTTPSAPSAQTPLTPRACRFGQQLLAPGAALWRLNINSCSKARSHLMMLAERSLFN